MDIGGREHDRLNNKKNWIKKRKLRLRDEVAEVLQGIVEVIEVVEIQEILAKT